MTPDALDDDRDFFRAPKRAQILASINPPRRSVSAAPEQQPRQQRPPQATADEEGRSASRRSGDKSSDVGQPGSFPFKQKRRRAGDEERDKGREEEGKRRRSEEADDFRQRRRSKEADDSRQSRRSEEADDSRQRRRSEEADAQRQRRRASDGKGEDRGGRKDHEPERKGDRERDSGRDRSTSERPEPVEAEEEQEHEHDSDTTKRARRHKHRHHHHRHHRHHRRPHDHDHDHHHRHKRRKDPISDDNGGNDKDMDDPEPPLDADAAFRQSLFDAMADDEGAAYWEAIYGQPVHEYAQEAAAQAAARAGRPLQPDDLLSAMTDDEYADYVRRRMWEKSDEGRQEAARRRRQQEKEKAKAEADDKARQAKEKSQYKQTLAAVEESLRRGAARQQQKAWQDRWAAYTDGWARFAATPTTEGIPWPAGVSVAGSGAEGDRGGNDRTQQIRAFFLGPDTDTSHAGRLREERVRWHPDKMQQRLGGQVDAETMRRVTEVFQVADRLWSEARKKA